MTCRVLSCLDLSCRDLSCPCRVLTCRVLAVSAVSAVPSPSVSAAAPRRPGGPPPPWRPPPGSIRGARLRSLFRGVSDKVLKNMTIPSFFPRPASRDGRGRKKVCTGPFFSVAFPLFSAGSEEFDPWDILPEGFPSGQRDQTVNLTRELRWFESTPLHQPGGGKAGGTWFAAAARVNAGIVQR